MKYVTRNYTVILTVDSKRLVWNCYSTAFMSQSREQKHFIISEVSADWHELMLPLRIKRPSTARDNGHLAPRCGMQTYHRLRQRHELFPVARTE